MLFLLIFFFFSLRISHVSALISYINTLYLYHFHLPIALSKPSVSPQLASEIHILLYFYFVSHVHAHTCACSRAPTHTLNPMNDALIYMCFKLTDHLGLGWHPRNKPTSKQTSWFCQPSAAVHCLFIWGGTLFSSICTDSATGVVFAGLTQTAVSLRVYRSNIS